MSSIEVDADLLVSTSSGTRQLSVDDFKTEATHAASALVSEEYDHLTLGYDGGGNLTSVVYRSGGSGGMVVATLTLGYAGGLLTTIART